MQGEELSKRIFDVINNVSENQFIYVHDIETGQSTWSQDAMEYFGFPSAVLENAKNVIGALVHPDDLPKWTKELEDAMTGKTDGFFYSHRIKNAQGEYEKCTAKGKLVANEKGEPEIFTGSITIHKKKPEYDSITDLPKMAEFLEDIRQTKKGQRECLAMAVEIRRFQGGNT